MYNRGAEREKSLLWKRGGSPEKASGKKVELEMNFEKTVGTEIPREGWTSAMERRLDCVTCWQLGL